MPIRQTLQFVPRDRPVSVMLRHGARHPIHSAEDGWNARLTEAGHEAARVLGAAISEHAPIRLFSSPIPRCEETATRLAEGLRERGCTVADAVVIRELAGPYLSDVVAVMEIALKIGDNAFVRQWFDGELDKGALVAPAEAARGQLEVLISTLGGDEPRTDLHASHDWNVLLVREHFIGVRHEDVGMPDFLDGIAVWRDEQELVVAYRNHTARHPIADFEQFGSRHRDDRGRRQGDDRSTRPEDDRDRRAGGGRG